MISESTDIIFSAPSGKTLYGNDGILVVEDENGNKIPNNYHTIYKTYVLIARKDDNY
jgi:hypothetical protein